MVAEEGMDGLVFVTHSSSNSDFYESSGVPVIRMIDFDSHQEVLRAISDVIPKKYRKYGVPL